MTDAMNFADSGQEQMVFEEGEAPMEVCPKLQWRRCFNVLSCRAELPSTTQWELIDRLQDKGVSASDTKKLKEAGLLTTKSVLRGTATAGAATAQSFHLAVLFEQPH
eukprot:SAG31_NODE_10779_length_1099_cov_1.026000_1_plen_107_part_00